MKLARVAAHLVALAAGVSMAVQAAPGVRGDGAGNDAFDATLLRIDEGRYLGQPVADVAVQTESGSTTLRAIAGDRPLALVLGYFSCHGICPATLRSVGAALASGVFPEHRVAVLSFDPHDTFDTLRDMRDGLERIPPGWTFGLLSRDDADALTRSIGYRFFFAERDRTYLHPAVVMFVSPEGRLTRYLWGTSLRAEDLRLAITEASRGVGHLNDLVSMVQLVCSRYDPARSRYVLHPAVMFGLVGLGLLAATGIAAFTYKRNIGGVPT